MSIFTVAECDEMITEYKAAIKRCLLNQSYSISGKSYTRANLKELEDGVQEWMKRKNQATRGGVGIRQGINANA